MRNLLYFLIVILLSSCQKEEIILPQIKQPKVDSSQLIKSNKIETKLKIKKKRKFKK